LPTRARWWPREASTSSARTITERSRLSRWTRIGRSANADIRLDDPSVSRRHALIVLEGRSLRILDDRSLNGVFLNGDIVEWGRLHDGDELTIGRYRLYALQG
jgi:pSer/pThr/pTyr-binding forkhead associated (FHA) protein